MEWESHSPCSSHTYPRQGCRSPGRHSSWELEFRDCGAILGQGPLLTVETWIEGMWGRRLWWEMPVEESWVSHGSKAILLSHAYRVAAAAKSLQSCPTLCDPIDGSPPDFPVPGILQARTPERVAISLSNAWKWKVKMKSLSHVQLLATPWTTAYQAPPSMGFSRQKY